MIIFHENMYDTETVFETTIINMNKKKQRKRSEKVEGDKARSTEIIRVAIDTVIRLYH